MPDWLDGNDHATMGPNPPESTTWTAVEVLRGLLEADVPELRSEAGTDASHTSPHWMVHRVVNGSRHSCPCGLAYVSRVLCPEAAPRLDTYSDIRTLTRNEDLSSFNAECELLYYVVVFDHVAESNVDNLRELLWRPHT